MKIMRNKTKIIVPGLILPVLAVFLLTGCGQPVEPAQGTVEPNQIATAAMQTVEAIQTQTEQSVVIQPTGTQVPAAEDTPTLVPSSTATELPTATPTATVTFTPTLTFTPSATNTPLPTATPTIGVLLSSNSLGIGEGFTASAYGFPANADIDIILKKQEASASVILDGITDEQGKASATLVIPIVAAKNEKWVVEVYTTGLSNNVSAVSGVITIKDPGVTAKVVVSSTSLKAGESFTVTVTGYPKEAAIDFRLGKDGQPYSVVLDGKTDENGIATVTMVIPASAVKREIWVVQVVTQGLIQQVSKTSPAITITEGGNASGGLVTVSSTSLRAGATFTVVVAGFPADAEIDFELGILGQPYSVVLDGLTDSTGSTAATLTIPASAVKGEKWVVTVRTTQLSNGIVRTSPLITIID